MHTIYKTTNLTEHIASTRISKDGKCWLKNDIHSKTNLELFLGFLELDEQVVGFLVADDEACRVAIDDGRVDEVLGRVADALEVTRNTNELFHLAEVLGANLLKRRSVLQLLLSVFEKKSKGDNNWATH